MSPARGQEADEFLENVDEVNALITGLKSGTISADYIDRKIKARDAEHEAEAERQVKEAEEAERRKYENLSPEEQKKIKAKVDEMIAEKERRERARAAFHEYRSKMPEDKQRATDYDAWDLWTPSDDETDPWMKYTPENPAFKAMEADIDKRHAAQVRARQTAHRKREEGNDAFRAGQFAEALKCYELGLEADKRSLELHGNAAMAALKCEMFVQCIDHATKACELAEFLLETPAHPTAIKCLQRRAAARLQLSHYKDALNDLSLAHRRDPGNAEVEKRLKEANAMYEEARKEKEVERGMRRASSGIDGEVDGTDFNTLREMEKLCVGIGGEECDYGRLETLLETSEQCRVFIRSGEGSRLLELRRVLGLAAGDLRGGAAKLLGPLKVLRAACLNETNRDTLARAGTLELVVKFIARAWNEADTASREAVSAALFLLHTCSATPGPRASIIKALSEDTKDTKGAVAGLFAMLERDLANDTGARLAAAHALSLLGNCAVDAAARTALASYHHDAPAKIVPVLRCGVPVLVERAAALLGNMCTDTTMRSKLAANARGISDLVALLPSEKDSTAGPAAPAGMGAGLAGLRVKAASPRDTVHVKGPELVLNVLAALANATADVTAAAAAGGGGGRRVGSPNCSQRRIQPWARARRRCSPASRAIQRRRKECARAAGRAARGRSLGSWARGYGRTPRRGRRAVRVTKKTKKLNRSRGWSRRCGRSRCWPTAATRRRGWRWRSARAKRWWSASVSGSSWATGWWATRRSPSVTWQRREPAVTNSPRSSRLSRCWRCATNVRARRRRTRRSRAPGWRRTRKCWRRSRRTTDWSSYTDTCSRSLDNFVSYQIRAIS